MKKKRTPIPRRPDEWLRIDAGATAERITEYIVRFCKHARINRAVVGVSGGIDSAVVTALLVRALGKKRVTGLILPSKTTPPSAIDMAMKCADAAGIHREIHHLEAMLKTWDVSAHPVSSVRKHRMRRGNFAARLRMSFLYDRAQALRALVAGTTNRSEWLIGYFTKHGDGACDYEPVAGLYKTQIYALSEALEVPPAITRTTPTAGFWKGQTDEGEIGMTYRRLDCILYALTDAHYHPVRIARMGFSKTDIAKVQRMMSLSAHKRISAPHGPRPVL